MTSERFSRTLIGVTDLQNDGHVYGATYTVAGRYGRPNHGWARLLPVLRGANHAMWTNGGAEG